MIKSWQMRFGVDHCDRELAEEVRRGRMEGRRTDGRSRAPDIKSNNPHLAGGEILPLEQNTDGSDIAGQNLQLSVCHEDDPFRV